METILGLLFFAALLYYVRKRLVGAKPANTLRPTATPRPKADDWIEACWREEKAQGPTSRPWFFDPVTPGQEKKLKELKVDTQGMALTKGMASDLIGMQMEADEHDIDVVKFFKVSSRGMNQARARYEAIKVLSVPGNKEKWENRPADGMEKELYRLAGQKAPKDLTVPQASAARDGLYQSMGVEKQAVWDTLQSLWDEIWDPYFTETYDRRRPSASAVRKAVESMVAAGTAADNISLDELLDKIDEMKDAAAAQPQD